MTFLRRHNSSCELVKIVQFGATRYYCLLHAQEHLIETSNDFFTI